MKKTIQITIGHRLFNIDEDAYEKLDKYLKSLRQYFGPGPETDEIISDIEDRIADLLTEMKQHSSSSVSIDDLDSIIDTMGTPQDIQAEDNLSTQESQDINPQPKKIHRILNGSIIAGVCNGIADYFNIDVSIVRLILVLLVLGSWGSLILLYILLWILLPVGDYSPVNSPRKKLYRDTDNGLLGGILAGIAQYFGYNVRNIRLIFMIPFLLVILSGFTGPPFSMFNILFSAGILSSILFTEVVIYFILWATVPAAVSPTDKMEMKGEPVNIESIKSQVYNSKNDKTSKSSSSTQVPRRQSSGCARVFTIIFIGLVIIGIIFFLLATVSSASVLMAMGLNLNTVKDFIFSSNSSSIWMNIIIICLILAPILSIVYLLSKRGRSSVAIKNLGLAALITWCVAILGSVSMIGLMSRDLRTQVSKTDDYTLVPKSDTLYIKYLEKSKYEIDYSAGLSDYIYEKNNTLYVYAITDFNVSDSPDDAFYAKLKKTTNGKSVEACEKRLENMEFKHKQVDDTLFISRFITISKPEVYRGQRISLDIAIPEGKSIIKPENLGNIDIRMDERGFVIKNKTDDNEEEEDYP